MNIKTFKGGYDNNFTYLIDNDKECFVIDPAVPSQQVLDYIKEKNLELKFVIFLHSHHDHIVEMDKYQVPIYGHESTNLKVDKKLSDNEEVGIEGVMFKVLHTPGHRFDCICLYDGKHLFTSDTLFVEGCGRVDFEGSDPQAMVETLNKLKQLPEHTIVLPGHDYGSIPVSTIKHEKEHNRFMKMTPKDFIKIRTS